MTQLKKRNMRVMKKERRTKLKLKKVTFLMMNQLMIT
jgi:hypothetical protein